MKKALSALIIIILVCYFAGSLKNEDKNQYSLINETRKVDYVDILGLIHVYIYGSGEKINTPYSSVVDYMIYYKDSKHMVVSLNGKEYVHASVPVSKWNNFKEADSKGSYYYNNFKGNSDYWVIGYDGNNGSKIVCHHN